MKKRRPLLQIVKVIVMMYIITGILLLILAGILYKFEISENAVNIGIIIIYIVAGLVGGFVMGKLTESRKYLWGLLVGTLYFAILLVVSLVLHETIEDGTMHFVMTMVLCAASGMAGGMVS